MNQSRRVALISGAGRNIGAATAVELAGRGYHVVVNYRSDAGAAAKVVAVIESQGGTAEAVQADVCDPDQAGDLVDRAQASHGRLDLLICNANTVTPQFVPFARLDWDTFAAKVNGELAGAFTLTQNALAIMRGQRSGRIIYISSTAMDVIGIALPHSVAKAALLSFSRHIAGIAAPYGVTVNTVAFGAVHTDATSKFSASFWEYTTDRSLSTRRMEPGDAARAVALVADDGFAFTSGQVIRVDNGFAVLDQQLHPLADVDGYH